MPNFIKQAGQGPAGELSDNVPEQSGQRCWGEFFGVIGFCVSFNLVFSIFHEGDWQKGYKQILKSLKFVENVGKTL